MGTFRALKYVGASVILLAGGLVSTFTPATAAAQPPSFPLPRVAQIDTSTAAGYAMALRAAGADGRQVAAALKLTSDDALLARSVVVDQPDEVHSNTLVHVRFDRTYKGLPVEGGQVLVGATAAGQITTVHGGELISITSMQPQLIAADAEHAAVTSTSLVHPKAAKSEPFSSCGDLVVL